MKSYDLVLFCFHLEIRTFSKLGSWKKINVKTDEFFLILILGSEKDIVTDIHTYLQ